jgi:hypothetical protein
MISKQKRCPPWHISVFDITSSTLPRFLMKFSTLYFLSRIFKEPVRCMLNPLAARGQCGRILNDFSRLPELDKYSSIHLQVLPFSVVRNWNLVTFNNASMEILHIGHLISKRRWSFLLALFHFFALRALMICKDVQLPISELFTFCSRHPTPELLSLEHYSLSLDIPIRQGGESLFPLSTALEAPLHHFEYLLPLIPVTQLTEVSFGKHPYNRFRYQPIRLGRNDRL